jgi:hypothetical protein
MQEITFFFDNKHQFQQDNTALLYYKTSIYNLKHNYSSNDFFLLFIFSFFSEICSHKSGYN